ncbi:hypothetical protein LXL04_013533 [Taraxacum kok-saghyz]
MDSSVDHLPPYSLTFSWQQENQQKLMDDPRRLNPHASPFYPSRFLYFKPSSDFNLPPPPPSLPPQQLPPRPPATAAEIGKRPFSYAALTPVPKGPRIPGGRALERRRATAGRGGAGDDGHRDGVRPAWIRKGVIREVTPLDPDESSTTMMLRNIPNNYTRKLLVELLDKHCKQENKKDENGVRSAFDFVYLPIAFNFEHLNGLESNKEIVITSLVTLTGNSGACSWSFSGRRISVGWLSWDIQCYEYRDSDCSEMQVFRIQMLARLGVE